MTYRLARQLKVHCGSGGNILCMPKTSDAYLSPHLTLVANEVTCRKCKNVLLSQNKDNCLFRITTSHQPDTCNITQISCDIFGNSKCLVLLEELEH